MNPSNFRIGIIGAGRLGTAIGHSLAVSGCAITAIYDISQERAAALADALSVGVSHDLTEMTSVCDAVIIAVKDDALFGIGAELAEFSGHRLKWLLHTSGLFPHSVIQGGIEYSSASMHPPVSAPLKFNGNPFVNICWTLQGEPEAIRFAASIAERLGGRAAIIDAESKAIYHAACALISNNIFVAFANNTGIDEYYNHALALFRQIGISDVNAHEMAFGLLLSAQANFKQNGLHGLTGAIARGDMTTMMAHLAALQGTDFREFYLRTAIELCILVNSPVLQVLRGM